MAAVEPAANAPLSSDSSYSASGSESAVMPAPTPMVVAPVSRSMTSVRMATLNVQSPPGRTMPIVPVYIPLGAPSSVAIISMVRILGAPVTEPQGKSARNRSTSVVDAGTSPSTVDVSCHSVG